MSRQGISIGGWFSLFYASFSFLAFLSLTTLAMINFIVMIGITAFDDMELDNSVNNQTASAIQMADSLLLAAQVCTIIQVFEKMKCTLKNPANELE